MPDATIPAASRAAQTATAGDARRWAWRLLAAVILITAYRGLALVFGHLNLYVDEAQYWTWAQALDWGFYSKPPMIALVIAATTALFGNGVTAIKLGALLLYPVSTWLIWHIARHLFDARVAFWSALAFLLLPGVSFSSLIISTDVPFFVFWCAALYAYLRALDYDRWGWWLAAGIAGGAGLQTKYTMIIFPASVLLHLAATPALRARLRSPKLWTAMLLAALIFLPNLLWNAAHGWPTLRHTEDISHLDSNPGLHWSHLGDFLAGQFAVMGPILFAAWTTLTLWRPARWWADPRYRLLGCFGLPFLVIICGQALAGRANANWGAMAYAAGTIFVVARLLQLGALRLLLAGIVFNALLMPVAYHFDWWTRVAGVRLTTHTDPYKRVRGWPRLAQAFDALRRRYPRALLLADARDTIAELRYYLQPRPAEVVLWNPDGSIDNQYALTTTMNDKRGRDFLYLGPPAALDARVRASFAAADDLGAIHIPIDPGYALDYHAWLLRDFRGYAGMRQVPR
ncbi:MAG: glycosyltransferase family 39 protein [Gammaproteobacteria bacterium]|nr:glycosyltransferase family 39 protein [Gammaproteobacteria bacterium]